MESTNIVDIVKLISDGNPVTAIIALIILMVIIVPIVIRYLNKWRGDHDIEMLGINSSKTIIENMNLEIDRQKQVIDRLNKNINTLQMALDISNDSLTTVSVHIKQYEYELGVANKRYEESLEVIAALNAKITKLKNRLTDLGGNNG